MQFIQNLGRLPMTENLSTESPRHFQLYPDVSIIFSRSPSPSFTIVPFPCVSHSLDLHELASRNPYFNTGAKIWDLNIILPSLNLLPS